MAHSFVWVFKTNIMLYYYTLSYKSRIVISGDCNISDYSFLIDTCPLPFTPCPLYWLPCRYPRINKESLLPIAKI